jgi:hypothetical protein
MRKRVIKALRPLDGRSVENGVGAGTPDVNYADGWIELKSLEAWPVKGGPLRVPHFTPQQKAWLVRRHKAGGAIWMLLKVGTEWLLLEGKDAAFLVGKSTREELIEAAVYTWQSEREMVSCLCRALRPGSDSGSSGAEKGKQ